MVASVSIPSMPEVALRPSYYIRAQVTFRARSCVGTVTSWHTACSRAGAPGMRSPGRFSLLIASSFASAALWLTTAVVDAQGIGVPGLVAAVARTGGRWPGGEG